MTVPTDPSRPQPIGPGGGPSAAQRTLLGCAVGCLGILALGATVAFFGWWWATTPGAQVATEPIVPEDAVAAIRIEGLGEDEGLAQLIEAVLRDYQEQARLQAEELPPLLRFVATLQRGSEPRPEEVRRWLPREATVVVEPATEHPDGYSVVAAVNLARYPRLLRFVLLGVLGRDESGLRYQHRGHPVRVEDDLTLGFLGSTILIGNHPPAIERAIDAVVDAGSPGRGQLEGEGVQSARVLADLARAHPGDWDVHGGFENRENILGQLWWDLVAPEPESASAGGTSGSEQGDEEPPVDPELEAATAAVEVVWLGLDVASADRLDLVLAFRCRDPQAARDWWQRIETDLATIQSSADEPGLELAVTPRFDGDQLDVRVRASGVREALLREMERSAGDVPAPARETE